MGSSYVLIQWQDLFTPGLLTPNMFIEKVFLQGVNDAYITGQSFLKTAGFLDRPILTIDGFMVNDKERTAACMNTLTNITTGLIGGWLSGAQAGSNLLPLGRGSTARTVAKNLSEQLAMKEIMSNPTKGRIIKLGKGMTDTRWPKSEGWVK